MPSHMLGTRSNNSQEVIGPPSTFHTDTGRSKPRNGGRSVHLRGPLAFSASSVPESYAQQFLGFADYRSTGPGASTRTWPGRETDMDFFFSSSGSPPDPRHIMSPAFVSSRKRSRSLLWGTITESRSRHQTRNTMDVYTMVKRWAWRTVSRMSTNTQRLV